MSLGMVWESDTVHCAVGKGGKPLSRIKIWSWPFKRQKKQSLQCSVTMSSRCFCSFPVKQEACGFDSVHAASFVPVQVVLPVRVSCMSQTLTSAYPSRSNCSQREGSLGPCPLKTESLPHIQQLSKSEAPRLRNDFEALPIINKLTFT